MVDHLAAKVDVYLSVYYHHCCDKLEEVWGKKLGGRAFFTVFNSKLKKAASFSRSLKHALLSWQSDKVSYILLYFFPRIPSSCFLESYNSSKYENLRLFNASLDK